MSTWDELKAELGTDGSWAVAKLLRDYLESERFVQITTSYHSTFALDVSGRVWKLIRRHAEYGGDYWTLETNKRERHIPDR